MSCVETESLALIALQSDNHPGIDCVLARKAGIVQSLVLTLVQADRSILEPESTLGPLMEQVAAVLSALSDAPTSSHNVCSCCNTHLAIAVWAPGPVGFFGRFWLEQPVACLKWFVLPYLAGCWFLAEAP
jgi:hypothetical protein